MKLIRTLMASAVLALPVALGGGSANAEAVWIPFHSDVTVPACPGFAVRIQGDGRYKVSLGDAVEFTASASSDSYTNILTGKSVSFSENSNASAVPNGDGTSTVFSNGAFALGGPAIGLVRITGQGTFQYSEIFGWVESYQLIAGRVTDICTLID